MASSDYPSDPESVKRRFEAACAEISIRCAQRRADVVQVTSFARGKGLDVTTAQVARHWEWFERWFTGGITIGYLINRTGVKRIEK